MFKLACGHVVVTMPWDNYITIIRRGCLKCAFEGK
jgi:hypothetical protein